MIMKNTLILTQKDNVATALENVQAGDQAGVYTSSGELTDSFCASGDIPRGHKIALQDIPSGGSVIKYGFQIGIASHEIRRGDYVHTHNLESARGRGDLE